MAVNIRVQQTQWKFFNNKWLLKQTLQYARSWLVKYGGHKAEGRRRRYAKHLNTIWRHNQEDHSRFSSCWEPQISDRWFVI
jgi:hypothetical protein